MGTAQTNNIVQFGGAKNSAGPGIVLPYTSQGNMIQLSAFINSSTASNFLMFSAWRATGSSGQYQVANGKTFRSAGGIFIFSGGGGNRFIFGTGTAALGSDNTATPPTGPVYYSSGATVSSMFTDTNNGTGSVWQWYPIYIEFAQNLYPFLKTVDSAASYGILIPGNEQ